MMWVGGITIIVGFIAYAITNDMPERKGFKVGEDCNMRSDPRLTVMVAQDSDMKTRAAQLTQEFKDRATNYRLVLAKKEVIFLTLSMCFFNWVMNNSHLVMVRYLQVSWRRCLTLIV
jgi:hypothetical protein